jgi:hypothetical protein
MQLQTVQSALKFQPIQDRLSPFNWRVEAINSRGSDVFVAIFYGPNAQQRAEEYAKFKNSSKQ